ncbi:hypothetical protein X975_16455, partial [Stegodyphus mimosarum]
MCICIVVWELLHNFMGTQERQYVTTYCLMFPYHGKSLYKNHKITPKLFYYLKSACMEMLC